MKPGKRKVVWSLLKCSMDIPGLAELFNTGLGMGLAHNHLELSIANISRIYSGEQKSSYFSRISASVLL